MGKVPKYCPECGKVCFRDHVDVGVGIMYSPWGCPACGWSEDPHFSHNPDPHIDSRGGYTPRPTELTGEEMMKETDDIFFIFTELLNIRCAMEDLRSLIELMVFSQLGEDVSDDLKAYQKSRKLRINGPEEEEEDE